MGQTRGLEPPHTGTTIRGLNHLATPAISTRTAFLVSKIILSCRPAVLAICDGTVHRALQHAENAVQVDFTDLTFSVGVSLHDSRRKSPAKLVQTLPDIFITVEAVFENHHRPFDCQAAIHDQAMDTLAIAQKSFAHMSFAD